MITEIRIYLEGGGDGKDTKGFLRLGMGSFLQSLREIARSKKIKWQVIACGDRESTFDDFKTALKIHANAFNILLVDSEGLVTDGPWTHLAKRDHWISPEVSDEHCHLMAQMMEAWFVADVDALKKFYGQEFIENAIPKNPNVEHIDKSDLVKALKNSTRRTVKGEYHKTHHASKLLERLDVTKVRRAAAHCDRLFSILAQKMGTSI